MPDAICAEPKLAEISDLLMLAKAEWQMGVPEFSRYTPRRRQVPGNRSKGKAFVAFPILLEKKGFLYVHIPSPDE